MHFNSSQSRSAWTEQEDDLLRNAVGIYGERSWANVAQMVPGRSSKSCSDRWRNFLSPDIEHPRKSPFTEWEIAVVVLAQARYGNNWKAISMLLPGRTNRAVKNLFVGNLKWGARLPEIRNRFLEWGMTLEALLEIKPDRAGGPVKPRPGQVLPDGTVSQDGSPLSGSPASTSSAGSAWQSDMTDHPNGSPGSANTCERRRRADGEMAANAGQQSSPVPKRRRGAQSPVLGGLQHQLQSPGLAPHPGALGPSFNGVSGTGSPTLGLTLPGAMGPPANRNPSSLMDPSGTLMLPKQPMGSSNGSNDGTGFIMGQQCETTPTSDLSGSDACGTLTPAGAIAAGLSGGCFGAAAAGLGILQQAGGPRTNSMPCGGLQQLLLGGDASMAGRVASWHYPGQMFGAHAGAMMDPAAAAAMAAARSASPFQQPAAQISAVSAAHIQGSLTSLLTDGSDTAAPAAAATAQPVKSECAPPAEAFQMQQHQQQQQHWMHQQHQHLQQQQQQQLLSSGAAGHESAATAADLSAMQACSGPMHRQQLHPSSRHGHEATTAAVVASAAMDLPMPGSPVLAVNLLTDMRSNDSAGLHSMLDQILNEDLNMADSALALLGGSDGLPMPAQRSSAFDPPVISLPTLQEAPPALQHPGAAASPSPHPQAPPPTPQGGLMLQGPGGAWGDGSAAGHSSSHRMCGNTAWTAPDYLDRSAAAMQGAQGGSSPAPASLQSPAGGLNPHVVGVKAEPALQGPAEGQINRAGSMGGAASQPGLQQQQYMQQAQPQPQVQQQQQSQSLQQVSQGQAVPSRPGSSAGMAPAGQSMQAASPSPEGALKPDMTVLCAQLQQENLLLMHKLHHLETQMAGSKTGSGPQTPGGQEGRVSAGDAGTQGSAPTAAPPAGTASMAAAPAPAAEAVPSAPPAAPAAAASAPSSSPRMVAAASAPVSYLSGFDALMPQLRPVLTRVGGSTGGAGTSGLSAAELGCVGGLMAESPAQLINTAFLDTDHDLLGDL